MKKTTIFIAIIAGTIMFQTSCQKQSSSDVVPSNALSQSGSFSVSSKPTVGDKTWVSITRDCFPPAYDCLPDVIVTGTRKNELSSALAGGPTGVRNYFLSTTGIACAVEIGLSQTQYNELTSGNYNLLAVNSGSVPGKVYFLAGPTATLSISNPEFVINIH